MMGAGLTFLLQHKAKMNVVLASALPIFSVALVFHFIPVTDTNLILGILFTASFVGMSAANFTLFEIVLGGGISTVLFLNIPPLYQGLGGGMGTSAFIAVLLTFGLRKLYEKTLKKAK